jgi:hypothetical protein
MLHEDQAIRRGVASARGPSGPKNIPQDAATSNPTRAITLTLAFGSRAR